MSFYHVLPSNAAPKTFPNNHASEFSIPLDNPYNLPGKWEVALMNMSYTGCVNTFYHDKVALSQVLDPKTRILKTQSPVRWKVPHQNTLGDMMREMEDLKDIVEVNLPYSQWRIKLDHMFVVLSPNLATLMKLGHGVWTPWDINARKWFEFNADDPMPDDISFTFVPISYSHETIEVKPSMYNMNIDELIESFNQKVPNATMLRNRESVQTTVSKHVLIFSLELAHFMNYDHCGINTKTSARRYVPNLRLSMDVPWTVDVYKLYKVDEHTDPLVQDIRLPPVSFQKHKDAVAYLNKYIPGATFDMEKRNYIQVTIPNENVKVTFSDTLRDILAMDETTYTGPGRFTATGLFTLTRRIHYLYVYSSITDYVRIGNTEAPLLAVIPFSVSSTCDILKEESYKNPMYIPLRHSNMSQIDIAIHDDAGALVPFVSEAATSLRLHFRQI